VLHRLTLAILIPPFKPSGWVVGGDVYSRRGSDSVSPTSLWSKTFGSRLVVWNFIL